jgi:hypothetical protein
MKTLILAWQDPESRSWFPIGQLTFDGEHYQFVYIQGVKEAQTKCKFQPLPSFPSFNKVYTSVDLFPLFSNRLMRPSRPDYQDYIKRLNIPQTEDDPIAILARSGGRKATDTFEVFPCPEPDENGLYHIYFFVHGLRYFPKCSIERIKELHKDEQLYLVHDAQNSYDPQALLLRTEDKYNVGYCPRYLVNDIHELLQQNPKLLHVHVERINPAPTPIQYCLLCNMTAEWHQDFHPFSNQEYQPIVDINTIQQNLG